MGPKQKALDNWLLNNRPHVYHALTGCLLYHCRHILNSQSGLELKGDDSVEESCAKYLEAFKAKAANEAKTL